MMAVRSEPSVSYRARGFSWCDLDRAYLGSFSWVAIRSNYRWWSHRKAGSGPTGCWSDQLEAGKVQITGLCASRAVVGQLQLEEFGAPTGEVWCQPGGSVGGKAGIFGRHTGAT